MSAARPIRRHLVGERPKDGRDMSGVLCVRAGDCKRAAFGTSPYRHGWTMDRARVTCPRCLEWMHA